MKTRMMFLAMMLVVLTAGFAVADEPIQNVDIGIDNKNNLNATGGNANSNQNQNQQQQQNQQQNQTMDNSGNSSIRDSGNSNVKDSGNSKSKSEVNGSGNSNQKTQNQNVYVNKGNLPTVGFNGFMSPGKADSGNWEILCSEMYMDWAADDVEEASYRKGFFDFITFNWGFNYEFTSMRKALPPNTKPTSCLNYWPGWDSLEGDRPLGAIDIVGKVNTPDAAFVAQAYDVCKKEKGSSWVAIIKENIKEDVTSGASLNISGALSRITGGGESGTAVASGIGFAKARVKKENSIVVKAFCMNDRRPQPQVVYVPPPPAPPVVKSEPAPKPAPVVCDESIYKNRIKALLEACEACPNNCLNNELLRKQLGDAYVQWFNCTGRTDNELLRKAIEQYKKAEINFSKGIEPNGKKTRNLKGAKDIIYKARYNWAWCVYVLEGYKAEMAFAQTKGLKSAPEKYEELKF